MNNISFFNVDIDGGFWQKQQELNRKVTVHAVYERFFNSGRFSALNCNWKDGDPLKPHIFWDSDVAKWLEGAAYIIKKHPDEKLEADIEKTIDAIAEQQLDTGYFNSYFITIEPTEKFKRRMDHELYCAGHLIEGAIAYYQVTGRRKLLDVMERYCDYIYNIFCVDGSADFETPGHQEIELALYRLYLETKKEQYLDMLRFFINRRGNSAKDRNDPVEPMYTQAHLPVREQEEAVGHCVRALYMYCAMQDLAKQDNDEPLRLACQNLFNNIVNKKLYITGGVGSSYVGEAFSPAYDLPDNIAYTETCASIALAMFCRRLWEDDINGRYADIAEQAIYNTVLAGISLSGDQFFYENPLAAEKDRTTYFHSLDHNDNRRGGMHLPIIERVGLFDTSCCPPNLVRFFSSIGDYAYSVAYNTIYTQMYMNSTSTIEVNNKSVTLKQETNYPFDGNIKISILSGDDFHIAPRIASWCENATIKYNDNPIEFTVKNGYAVINQALKKGDVLEILMPFSPLIIEATPNCTAYCGRLAVMRGPLVYCVEGIDCNGYNVRDIRIPHTAKFDLTFENIADYNLPILTTTGTARKADENLYRTTALPREEVRVRMIPYFSWANRARTDMTVWLLSD